MLCKENQSDCLTWHYIIHKKLFKKRDEKKGGDIDFFKTKMWNFRCELTSMLNSWYMLCHVTLSLIWMGISFALINIIIILTLNNNFSRKSNDYFHDNLFIISVLTLFVTLAKSFFE